ncbi:hypothetical protein A3K64_02635 [Candidatus Micrarchaeota archaeon RBG_16_36_9]|nr:MAG: hypothetical protein A3K64_02635 [Candidatus Micrarchaeota archaeon RBG_16_36_9]
MKGVSAIIAIVLLVMITISLAGLAWLWIFNLSTVLENTVTNTTRRATENMGMQARIQVARFYPIRWVNATILNTGTVDIDLSKLGIFIDDVLTINYVPNTSKIMPGGMETINITNTTPACNKVLRITFPSGVDDYKTISC